MILLFDLPDGDDRRQIAVNIQGTPPVGAVVSLSRSTSKYEILRYEVDVKGSDREPYGTLTAVLAEHQTGPVTLEA